MTELWATSPISGREDGLPDWLQWYGLTNWANERYTYNTGDGAHPGLDFGVLDFQEYDEGGGKGIPVKAGVKGDRTVTEVGQDSSGLGRVTIRMGEQTAIYDHLLPESIKVQPGQSVDFDKVLGYLEPIKQHLHLELRNSDNSVINPFPYFDVNLQARFRVKASNQYQQNLVTYPLGHAYPNPAIQPPTYHNR